MTDLYRGVTKFELLKMHRHYLLGLPMSLGGSAGLIGFASWSELPVQNTQSLSLLGLSAALVALGLYLAHRLFKVRGQLNQYL